jgi:site-specific recombinase XerD
MEKNTTLTLDPEFLNSLNSENTRLSYQNDIRGFIEFANVTNLTGTSRDDILRWKEHLMIVGGRDGEPSAPYTVARKLSSLRAYFSFLSEHRNHPNRFTDIKAPTRVVKNERQILDIEEIEEMIEKTKNSTSGPLHAALIAINFYAVIRLNEFLKAKLEDFFREKNLNPLEQKILSLINSWEVQPRLFFVQKKNLSRVIKTLLQNSLPRKIMTLRKWPNL